MEACTACSACGSPQESQRRIEELEYHVQVLTQQSADALDRLAAYEEEIRQLKLQRYSGVAVKASPRKPQHHHNVSFDSVVSTHSYNMERFVSFDLTRKDSAMSSMDSADVFDLQSQLAKEQAARIEAEKNVEQLNSELEDLSVSLFEQANEMVAKERRARSKLEKRVKTLEQREKDKSRRLDKVDAALDRIERVRMLLGPPTPSD